MKPKNSSFRSPLFFTLCIAACLPVAVNATEITWDGAVDGGGPATGDPNWSNGTNWVGEAAPAATGDSLVFAGTTGLANTNNSATVTNLNQAGSITFADGADPFVLSGDVIIMGASASSTIVTQNSASDQEIAFPVNLVGGNKTRNIVFGSPAGGPGKVTISGNLDTSNSTLMMSAGVGILALTGNNSGPGTGLGTYGVNDARFSLRNSINGNTVELGSPTALGSPDPSFTTRYCFRAVDSTLLQASTDLTDTNAVQNTLAITSNSNKTITFQGSNDLEVAGVIAADGGTHSLSLNDTGSMAIGSNGVSLASGETAKTFKTFVSGTGELTIDGALYDTYNSVGILTQKAATVGGDMVDSTFEKQNSGTLNLNGDSSTYNGEIVIYDGTVVLGNANALGNNSGIRTNHAQNKNGTSNQSTFLTGATTLTGVFTVGIEAGDEVSGPGIAAGTTVDSVTYGAPDEVALSQAVTSDETNVTVFFQRNVAIVPGKTAIKTIATLDLNGQTTAETFSEISGKFINSNTGSTAEITTNIEGLGFVNVDGSGDIILPTVRLVTGSVQRQIVKNGAGTLTLSGALTNNRYGLTVNEGNVNLAKTSGDAVFSYPMQINGPSSVVKLTVKSNQLHDSVNQEINTGTFDLNGFDEACGGLNLTTGTLLTGGTITNNGAGPSTLTLGAGSSSSDRTWPGTITDGTGILSLVKGRPIVQTLTGTLAYTGDTTINEGILELGATSALANGSAVRINGATSILKLADGVTDVVNELWIDGVQLDSGLYGSSTSSAPLANQDDVHFSGTGTLSVTTGPASNDYDTWAALYTPADLTNMAGDNDNDGLTNQQEYAFGLSPVDGSSVNPILVQLDKGAGTFTYQRRATTGLTYTVLTSPDLVTWTLDENAIQDATTVGDNESVLVTLTGPLPATKFFVRVKAD